MLKRLVFISNDLSSIGGISERLKKIQNHQNTRGCEYFVLSKTNSSGDIIRNNITTHGNEKEVLSILSKWKSENNTVFITPNNFLTLHHRDIRQEVGSFPLIYMCSGQMAFMVQDSTVIGKLDHVRSFKASKIVAFSDSDIDFQRQLGIHGQIKGFLPVAVRKRNTFDPSRTKSLGYVGRIDFHAKGCERLIDIARSVKKNGLAPIKLFTTAGQNSPDYHRLMQMINHEYLNDQFDITLECTDKDTIYKDISMLLLPSKKESFGNVILEAYSYGIPVMSTAYAPGPSELIDHNKTGYLLDDFSGDNVVDIFKRTDDKKISSMSAAAFKKHKKYSMESHFDFLERIAADALNEFKGENTLPVFPELKLAHELAHVKKQLDNELRLKKARQIKPSVEKLTRDSHASVHEIGSYRDVDRLESIASLAAEIRELESRRETSRNYRKFHK